MHEVKKKDPAEKISLRMKKMSRISDSVDRWAWQGWGRGGLRRTPENGLLTVVPSKGSVNYIIEKCEMRRFLSK